MCPAAGHGINSLAVPVSGHEGFDSKGLPAHQS
jgi:hypothetical protein